MSDDNLPLRGLTVVEFSTSVAAPFAGQVLADLGARVLKVENPEHGDDARNWGPPFADNGMSPVFNSFNRNKRSLAVNLKDDAQRERLRDFIARRADIVLQNLRPGLLASLGLDAPTMREQSPRLIWCDLNAFGASGPKKMQPGYDPLMQACGGIMSITGLEGQEPVRVGPSIVDQGAGMWAVIGILAALRERDLTGKGTEISTSLYETAIGWLPVQIATYFLNGKVPRKFGTENFGYAPCKAFEAEDGWLMLAAGNDRLFDKLTGAIGDADFANDPDFANNPLRVENRDKLNTRLQDLIGHGRRDDWVARLTAVGVPCSAILSIDEVVVDPQFEAVAMEQSLPDDAMRLIGLPLMFDGERPPLRHGPPALGEATDLLNEGVEFMTDLPEMKRLKLEEVETGILLVSFDRPDVMNAIDTATCEDLRTLFGPLGRNPGPWRAIILTGTGDRAFCAGGDLKERQGMTDDAWRAQHDIIEEGAWALLNATAPTIAAVNGVAYGGGCELALCCDFIYAADSARFALPEVTRGIIPGGGGTQTLPRAVGERRAKELMMTGRPFSADDALGWGMVNRVVPQAELLPAALDTARAVAANAPVAVQQVKKAVRHGLQADLTRGLEIEILAYGRTIGTEDRLEGVRAFNEKRKPEFKGR